jgi:hypothetical protein
MPRREDHESVIAGLSQRRWIGCIDALTFSRVENLADRAVADRVGGDVEPGLVEPPDRAAEVVGVRPHRVVAVAVGVGLLEPRRAGVDDAVEHELHRVGGPHRAAEVAASDDLGERLGVVARVDPLVEADTQVEQARGLERAERLDGLDATIHLVDPREPHGVLGADDVGHPAEPLLVARLRDAVPHRADRAHLAQLAGGRAVAVHDDDRAVLELARPRDAGDAQRSTVGEAGVHVEGVDEHRAGTSGLVDEGMVVVGALQGVVLEGEAGDPRVRTEPLALGAQERTDLGEGRDAVEVDALGDLRSHEQVLVPVGETGGDVPVRAGEHRGAGVAGLAHLGGVADSDDDTVLDRDRRRPRTVRVQGADAGVDDGEVGRHGSSSGRREVTVVTTSRFGNGPVKTIDAGLRGT